MSLRSINIYLTLLTYLFSRFAIMIGMIHFIWTFSEFHAILIASFLLVNEIASNGIKKIADQINEEKNNEQSNL